MTLYTTPIKPKSVSDQVYDQIETLIYLNQLKPGEKLLAEQELSKIMRVGRSSIREAIQRLTAKGLVFQVHGKGVFVRSHDDQLQNPLALAIKEQKISLESLLEVRLSMETNAASLAALRSNESDIKVLEHAYHQMENDHDDNLIRSQADAAFHMAIAIASKNPLYTMIMRNFDDYLFHGIRESMASLHADPENVHRIRRQHFTILESIKLRRAKQARNAMEAHIRFANRILLGKN